MDYSAQEVMQYAREADVKMIRLAFCDVFGRQKNIVIMPRELERAFGYGIAIDGSAIAGFGGAVRSDLMLRPEPATLSLLPWRPETGKVVRMFCDIYYPDGTPFECDTRALLKKAAAEAERRGAVFTFGPEMEFYLFKNDIQGEPTKIPHDQAGYMDIAPEDKGESVRREICLMMEEMGILPECSHHEEGPGQNEIDFRYAGAVAAADNAVIFKSIVRTVAARNGLTADFSPKPLKDKAGSGMHVNFAVRSLKGEDTMSQAIAGIMDRIEGLTAFLNPCRESYERLEGTRPRAISPVQPEPLPAHPHPCGGGGVQTGGAALPGPGGEPLSGLCPAHLCGPGGYGEEVAAAGVRGHKPVFRPAPGALKIQAPAGGPG